MVCTRTPQTARFSRSRKTASSSGSSRSKYPEIIRVLCDEDAASRRPSDFSSFRTRLCTNCRSIGTSFDRTVYLPGRAGWSIRICRRCHYKHYPPQTPPTEEFSMMIEAKRAELQAGSDDSSPLARRHSDPVSCLGESSSSAGPSSSQSRSGQGPADIAADERAARKLQREINAEDGQRVIKGYPTVDWPSDVFYNPTSTLKQTELDLARDAALARSLQAKDAVPVSKKPNARASATPLLESPTIFQAKERDGRRSSLTLAMMGMVDKVQTKSTPRKRARKAKRGLPKTPTPQTKKTPQPFPMDFSPLRQSTPTPKSSSSSGNNDTEVVVKIEPGTAPSHKDVSAMPQSGRAPSVISLSSDSDMESPVKSQAPAATSGRAASVISISSESEDESPPRKKMRKPIEPAHPRASTHSTPSLTGPSQSEDAATSLVQLATGARDLPSLTHAAVSPTVSDFATNTSNKENEQAALVTPPASNPRVVLRAPVPARSALPEPVNEYTPRTTARMATLSLPWPGGKPPTSLADVNEQAIQAMRKIMAHILEGTVVAESLHSEDAPAIPHTSWVEAEYPLHLPRPHSDVVMKEASDVYKDDEGERAQDKDEESEHGETEHDDSERDDIERDDSEHDDSEGSQASADAMDAEDEPRSPLPKSSASSSSSESDWLIEVCPEDPPFPGVFGFEVHPSLRDLRTTGSFPKFHICARWLLKIVIWFRVDLPPVVKMITLDEATYDMVLSQYFITRRVFDTTGIYEFRLWSRSSMDWKVCRPYDRIPVSITENHTLLIRLPTVNNPVGFPEMLLEAMGPCTNVDHTRYSPHSRKGKARAIE